jgi:hypothetical protein
VSVDHDTLQALLTRLKAPRKSLKAEAVLTVGKLALRNEANALGRDWHGNPPDIPKVRKVEFSKKEVLREEVEIYRQPDHGCPEAC